MMDRLVRTFSLCPNRLPQTPPGHAAPVPPPQEDTVEQPTLIRTVDPTYPAIAKAAQIEGNVVLAFVVRRDGTVADVQVLQALHPLLDDEAVKAVRQYVYKPGLRNGEPDAFPVQWTVSFRLR